MPRAKEPADMTRRIAQPGAVAQGKSLRPLLDGIMESRYVAHGTHSGWSRGRAFWEDSMRREQAVLVLVIVLDSSKGVTERAMSLAGQ